MKCCYEESKLVREWESGGAAGGVGDANLLVRIVEIIGGA